MRRTGKAFGTLAAATSLSLLGGGLAFADTIVSNDVATAGDTTLAAGATGNARFHLVATDGVGGAQDANGCNATPDKPVTLTLTSSNLGVVEFPSGATLRFTGCDNPLTAEIDNSASHAYTVKSTATGGATTTITGTATGGIPSSRYTNDGFVVRVAAPSDSTVPTARHAITSGANGAGWFKTSPVMVDVTGEDETLLHSITYTLNGVSATVLASGGVKTATVPVTVGEDRRHALSYTAKDGAGNVSALRTVDFGIDTVAPALAGAPSAVGKNAQDWYRAPVTVNWTASDATSGLVAGVPSPSTIGGEGRGKTASTSVSDIAGHTTPATSSPGVNIDATAPTISGQVIKSATDRTARPVDGTSPDGKSWYNTPALVAFTCADPKLADGSNGSGAVECSSDEAVATNGAAQSVNGATKDLAGNEASGAVSGINVDMAAPVTTSDLSCGSANSTTFCKSTVEVTLTASDALSAVKAIHYSTDGGTKWQTANGASKAITIPLNGTGRASVKFQAVDHAGNLEAVQSETIKYDNIAPQVTGTKTPAANQPGWNNADTVVSFSATDEEDGSGVKDGSVTADVPMSGNTPVTGVNVKGSAEDNAGNIGETTVNVKIDVTPPTIGAKTVNAAGAEVTANTAGWFNDAVKVDFTCQDALSGVNSCADDATFTTDGTHSITGDVSDIAGNNGTPVTVSGIKIDGTKPTVSVTGITEGAVYKLGQVPTAVCTPADLGGSGIVGDCTVSRAGGTTNGVGAFTYTATAQDAAGNVSDATVIKYSVQYRWDGFLQPINDTAHQTGASTSIFKGGSTVPAKFQLKNSAGDPVQANTAPQWLTPAKGSAVSAPVDEALYGEAATGGSTYAWDGTAQHYKYNWGTAKAQAGNYWRIGVKLDDGTVRYVNLGLRS